MKVKSSDSNLSSSEAQDPLATFGISLLYCASNCSASSEPTQIKERLLNEFPCLPEDQVVEFTQKNKNKNKNRKNKEKRIMVKGIFFKLCLPL